MAVPAVVTAASGCLGIGTECGLVGCSDQVTAQGPRATPGHAVSFKVCRAGQCATGTLRDGGGRTKLAVPGADCDVGNVIDAFTISCVPNGTLLQTGEEWSMWAEDVGLPSDAGVSSTTILLDVTKAIVVATTAPNGDACGPICRQASLT